jgi:hypothetical protein
MSNYYQEEGISQSMIKTFIKDKYLYKGLYIDKNIPHQDTEDMSFGRFCHTVYYENYLVDREYISIPDSSMIGGMMGDYIKYLITMTPEEAYTNSGFKISHSRVKEDFENGTKAALYKNYYNSLLEASGKQIISQEWFSTANSMKMIYQRDNHILEMARNKEWSIYREQIIFWRSNFTNLLLKAKIDCIYISPNFTEVYIEDLKTCSVYNLSEFIYSIKKYGYDIQQSFYKLAVQSWIEERFGIIIPYSNIKFVFIPQRTSYPFNIIDFVEIHSKDEDIAYNKWTNALTDLEYCIISNNWTLDKSKYIEYRKIISL